MARFYPTIDDDFHGSDGEIQVYQALQQLSDGYVVFHSFRWLGEPGHPAEGADCRFLGVRSAGREPVPGAEHEDSWCTIV